MTEQQVNTNLLEETRREITKLVAEIEHLASQDITEQEFFSEFSRRISTALAAHATAMWMKTTAGNLQLNYQINFQQVGLDTDADRAAHGELLRYMMVNPKPILVTPHSGPGEEGEADSALTNPTNFLLVLAPITIEGQTIGVMEVFQDPGRRSAAHRGYLQFLVRMATEAAKYFKNRQFRHFLDQQKLWDDLENFSRAVHGGLNPKQTSYLIANDGRKLIGCERVSVAIKRGKKTRIESISGQDVVEKKSNLVRTMAKLVETVLQHGENLIYHGKKEEHWPTDIQQSLDRYLEESNSRLVAVVPMHDKREFGRVGKAEAALVVEMIEDEMLPDEIGGRIDAVARHSTVALYNAMEHYRIPFLPVLRFVGNSTQWISWNTMPKVGLAVVLIAALTIFMILFPWPLRMEGRGELVPEKRRVVYAPKTGIITKVDVRRGTPLEEGSNLVSIYDPELEQREKKVRGELEAAITTLAGLQNQQKQDGKDFDSELGAKITQQRLEIQRKKDELQQIKRLIEDLTVRSPISGEVMDWDPVQKLGGRPVQQGDVLLEIANTNGDWILEVEFPENTISHIARAQREAPDPHDPSDNVNLPVTFVLSNSPDKTYKGTLYKISTQAETKDQENIIRGQIRLDKGEEVPQLTSGVEVRVKVDCGPHPVGYVLFREVIDFVREYVFF